MSGLQKNVASQVIFFGLVSATTGAGLAGATVSKFITKDAGAQASGGGSITDLGNGQYSYAPTQAETNATAVGLAFTATGAVPVYYHFYTDIVDGSGLPSVNLVDIAGSAVSTSTAQLGVNVVNIKGSASTGTAGYVGIDWGNVNAPTTTLNLSGTTISTAQVIASVSGAVGSVTGAVGSVTGSVASVLTGGLIDLTTTTYAEPSSVPAATASLKDKIGWLTTTARNKITQTATTQLIRNDSDAGTIGTSTVSDDGTTAIRGKYT